MDKNRGLTDLYIIFHYNDRFYQKDNLFSTDGNFKTLVAFRFLIWLPKRDLENRSSFRSDRYRMKRSPELSGEKFLNHVKRFLH